MVTRSAPLDYCLRGSMKSMVYGTPVTAEEDLIARVQGAIESLKTPALMCHVREAQYRRCRRLCNDVGGTQFEPRLYFRLLDVLPMFGLLTYGKYTLRLYCAQAVRFRTGIQT